MGYQLTKTQIENAVQKAAECLFTYCLKGNIRYVIIGSSGGLDSAVTLGIAQIARGIAEENGFALRSIGAVLPCETSGTATSLGGEAIKKFGAEKIFLDITGWEQYYVNIIEPQLDSQIVRILAQDDLGFDLDTNEWDNANVVAKGNVKARLRMIVMYDAIKKITHKRGGIVLSTSNLSEEFMGFWTINGDVGDYGPLMNIFKGLELYDIARYLEVPQAIIDAMPDDGLGITSGGDETQLGAPYSLIDRVMITLIQNGFETEGGWEQLGRSMPFVEGATPTLIFDLARRCLRNVFKRKADKTPRPSREELGLTAIKDIKQEE